jgi:hypothetical protein
LQAVPSFSENDNLEKENIFFNMFHFTDDIDDIDDIDLWGGQKLLGYSSRVYWRERWRLRRLFYTCFRTFNIGWRDQASKHT